MSGVIVLGASSAIARALAARLARSGRDVLLAGRDSEELKRIASDLSIRSGRAVEWLRLEATDFDSHSSFVEECSRRLPGWEGVIFAVGLLGDQPRDSQDPASARRLIEVNLTSGVSLLSLFANAMETRKSGFILGISSVAGDRGRQSNYAYGAAKGGFSVFLQGLRNRLDGKGVRVYTLKPGFVDTAMTYGKPGLFAVASPDRIARDCMAILDKPGGVYYRPRFWRPLMWVVRAVPERIFKKLKL